MIISTRLKHIVIGILCLAANQNILALSEQTIISFENEKISIDSVFHDGVVYADINIPGLLSSDKVGAPDLPIKYIKFLVPRYTRNFRISISSIGTESEKQLFGLPKPIQELQPYGNNSKQIFVYPIDSLYSAFSKYHAEVKEDYYLDGYNHIVTAEISPVRFVGNTMFFADKLSVNLEYDMCTQDELSDCVINSPIGSVNFNIENIVVNPQKISSYVNRSNNIGIVKQKRYYIITPKSLEPGLNDLMTWKQQKGYKVIVKCVEDILANPQYHIGSRHNCGTYSEVLVDSASSVRAYLRDEYKTVGSFYCLLVGNSKTTMPIRRTRNSALTQLKHFTPNGYYYTPTDTYFSDLTSYWDLTKISNDIGSEIVFSAPESSTKYAPDIIVGRLLCSSINEIKNYIPKLIIYESNPGKGDVSYIANHVYFEQDKWEDKIINNEIIRVSTGSGMIGEASTVLKLFNPFPETTTVIADLCLIKNCDYHLQVPHYGKNIIKAIGNCGFSSWHAHGSPALIGCCDSQYFIVPNSQYSAEQVNHIIKDHDKNCGLNDLFNVSKPSIAYSISCTISPFDVYYDNEDESECKHHFYDVPYNFGSAFTVAGKYGGPAILANTRYGFVSSSAVLESYFGQEILKNSKIGIAEANSKMYSGVSSHLIHTHNLIGDPELDMWTTLPKKFENIHFRSFGQSIESESLSGAVVVYHNGENSSISYIARSSSFTTPDSIGSPVYCVSVWKRGLLPVIKMFAPRGKMLKQTKRFIVQTAELGNSESDSFEVGDKSLLFVNASDEIIVNKNFNVSNGGKVELICSNSITLNSGLIKSGGKLTVTAKNIKLGSGFKVEEGGILNINNINYDEAL